jgi:hypothetical protein
MNDDEEVIMAIQGWVKLFVQHLHAKSILEAFAKQRGREMIPIDIKVYGVSPSKNPLPLPTWEDLEKILRSSLQDETTEQQNEMIKVFRSHFETSDNLNMAEVPTNDNNTATAQTDTDDSLGKNQIFSVISDIITQRGKNRARYYNMHCEAALASLVSASKCPLKVAPYADEEIVAELHVGRVPFI